MKGMQNNRFQELEERFSQLDQKLKDSPEKEAISLLHAMLQQTRRALAQGAAAPQPGDGDTTLAAVAELYKSAPDMEGTAENEGLPVGSPAPDFTLPDKDGNPVALSDFRGRNVILAFYPLDWSPGCSDQLSLYQSELDEFERLNAQVIGISVDSLYSHGAWAAVRGIEFPLLSDFNPRGAAARRYQVMRDDDGFTERALFLIDGAGVIRYKEIAPQLSHIPDIYALLEQLQALQQPAERTRA
jgi:peroxiredoxin